VPRLRQADPDMRRPWTTSDTMRRMYKETSLEAERQFAPDAAQEETEPVRIRWEESHRNSTKFPPNSHHHLDRRPTVAMVRASVIADEQNGRTNETTTTTIL
jgi:hypothetical protein